MWTVAIAGFCAFLNLYATQPILPLLAQVFGVSKAGVSLTVTASTLGVALAAPFMGRLADRYGRRRLIVISALLLGVTSLLAATSSGLHQLIFWRFLQGVFTPGVFSVTVTYINDEWAGGNVGSAMSAYVSGTVIGGFAGRVVSGFVADRVAWRWSFVALGLADLAMTAVIWRSLPQEKRAGHAGSDALFAAMLGHLSNRALLARYIAGFCVLFSLVGTFTYVTFYLAAPPFSLGPAVLGSIFIVYLVGAMVTPLAGLWLDRLGSRRMLLFAGAAGMVGVVVTLEPKLWAVATGLAICCSGVFIAQTAVNSSLGACAHNHRALAVGLYASFYYFGGSAGASLPAWAWSAGGWKACVAMIAAVQTATLVIAAFFWEAPRSRVAHAFRQC